MPQHLLLAGSPGPHVQFQCLMEVAPLLDIRNHVAAGLGIQIQGRHHRRKQFRPYLRVPAQGHAEVAELINVLGLRPLKPEALVDFEEDVFERRNASHGALCGSGTGILPDASLATP